MLQRWGAAFPSDRLRLREAGFADATCWDFDKACYTLVARIDEKLGERTMVAVPTTQPPKGHHFEPRPVWNLLELLYEEEPDPEREEQAAEYARGLLASITSQRPATPEQVS